MRLPEAKIKQAILRPELDIRQLAIRYFPVCHSDDEEVAPLVIQAVEKCGREDAYHLIGHSVEVRQTEETISWIVDELNDPDSDRFENYTYNLTRVLCHADPTLVLPRQAAILESRHFYRGLQEDFTRRLGLLSWDAAACWRRLEEICEDGKDKQHASEIEMSLAKNILEVLARIDGTLEDRVIPVLAQQVEDFENNPMKWLEPLMVTLAGLARLETAVPLIVRKLHEDDGEAQERRKPYDGRCQADAITGRSKVEQERDRLQNMLTAAVECLPFSFWALDSQGRYALANAASRTLWGEFVGQRPADVAGDEQRLSAWLDNHRRAWAGEKVENEAEFTVGGEARSFHNVIAPIRMGEHIIGILGFNIDITEWKQMEAALRESEDLFQAFMDNAPGVAWIKDEQGHFVYINKRSGKVLGVPREEWIGKTDFDLWPKELAEQYKKHDLEVLTGGQAKEFVEEAATEGGDSYWWSFKFPFRYATGKMCVGGIAVDITERRRAEETLQKAHDELEAKIQQRTAELAIFHRFAEASSQGFGMAELDGRIAYVNPAMCRLIGEANPGDAIGRPMWSYYLEGMKERRANEILPALERDGFWEGELPMLSGQGALAPPLHHLFLLRDAEGKPVRRCVIVTDMSERKQADALLTAPGSVLAERLRSSLSPRRWLRSTDWHNWSQSATHSCESIELGIWSRLRLALQSDSRLCRWMAANLSPEVCRTIVATAHRTTGRSGRWQ